MNSSKITIFYHEKLIIEIKEHTYLFIDKNIMSRLILFGVIFFLLFNYNYAETTKYIYQFTGSYNPFTFMENFNELMENLQLDDCNYKANLTHNLYSQKNITVYDTINQTLKHRLARLVIINYKYSSNISLTILNFDPEPLLKVYIYPSVNYNSTEHSLTYTTFNQGDDYYSFYMLQNEVNNLSSNEFQIDKPMFASYITKYLNLFEETFELSNFEMLFPFEKFYYQTNDYLDIVINSTQINGRLDIIHNENHIYEPLIFFSWISDSVKCSYDLFNELKTI